MLSWQLWLHGVLQAADLADDGVLACYRQDMIVRMMTETSQSTDVSWSLNKLLETALCPGQTNSIAAQASAVTREKLTTKFLLQHRFHLHP